MTASRIGWCLNIDPSGRVQRQQALLYVAELTATPKA